jgi:hypothetical protein
MCPPNAVGMEALAASSGSATSAADPGAGSEPITKSGSSSDFTSFDDLDNMPATKTQRAKTASQDEEDERPAKAKGKADADEADGDEDAGDAKVTKAKQALDEKRKADEAKAAKGQPKPYRVKLGDKDVDLPADTKLQVTVDGKPAEVSLSDLASEFAGKTNWGKKYQELDTERKTFQAERQDLQTGVDKLVNLSKDDPTRPQWITSAKPSGKTPKSSGSDSASRSWPPLRTGPSCLPSNALNRRSSRKPSTTNRAPTGSRPSESRNSSNATLMPASKLQRPSTI